MLSSESLLACLAAGVYTLVVAGVTAVVVWRVLWCLGVIVPPAQPQPAQPQPAQLVTQFKPAQPLKCAESETCGCGGILGDITKLVALDDGVYERRQCLSCRKVYLIKRETASGEKDQLI